MYSQYAHKRGIHIWSIVCSIDYSGKTINSSYLGARHSYKYARIMHSRHQYFRLVTEIKQHD